jgi:sigma-B regulation protein RsbU (phosphoserine phosphatase)
MHTLVRLQTEFLLTNLAQVEASRFEIAAKNRELEDDLRMAREVQTALLPQGRAAFAAAGCTVGFAHVYRPSGGISGDFFDTFPVSDRAVGLLVCDVMGHGVRSALITAMIRAMVEQFHPLAADPAAFLTRLNHDLTRMLRRAGGLIFVTAAYLVIDLESGRLRYAQAGHPTPLHWHAAADELRPIPCTDAEAGPALGLLDEFSYLAVETPIAPGDRVLLFTDGISEAAAPTGEEFGAARMAASLRRSAAAPLAAWVEGLVTDASTFAGAPVGDDVCVVAAEYRA